MTKADEKKIGIAIGPKKSISVFPYTLLNIQRCKHEMQHKLK